MEESLEQSMKVLRRPGPVVNSKSRVGKTDVETGQKLPVGKEGVSPRLSGGVSQTSAPVGERHGATAVLGSFRWDP